MVLVPARSLKVSSGGKIERRDPVSPGLQGSRKSTPLRLRFQVCKVCKSLLTVAGAR